MPNDNVPKLSHDFTDDKKAREPHHVEYADVAEIEHKADLDAEQGHLNENINEGFDPELLKRTTRKVDWRLIPILTAMYCVSLIDRTNLSLARQANDMYMDIELGTAYGQRYSIITLVFFIPYIILEIPSQLGLRKFGARWWLGSATFLWGVVMLGMGFAPDWQTLAGLRALLGVFESALFPGAAYLISCWYPRRSMATRNSVFYIVSGLVGSLASPLGYAMSLLHGRAGLSGWQWIFIFFGIITCVVGIAGILFIVDFPDRATFLTEEQKHLILTRIQRDRGDAKPDPVTWAKIGKHLCDWKIWLFGLMFMSATVAAYSLAYFLPVILASMGFTNVQSMLLGTPTNVYAFIPALTTAYIADKIKGTRAYVVMFNALFVIIGTAMYSQLPLSQKAARYAGVFLAVGGCNGNVPLVISWAQTSIRSQSKRAVTAAVIVAWGGIGGILSGVVFIQKEMRSGYPTGIFFTIGMNAFTMVAALLLSFWFRYQNKRADRGEVVLENAEDFRYHT